VSFFSFSSFLALSVGSETFYASLERMQNGKGLLYCYGWGVASFSVHFDSNGKRKRKFCAHAFSFSVLTTAGMKGERNGLWEIGNGEWAWECFMGGHVGLCVHIRLGDRIARSTSPFDHFRRKKRELTFYKF